MSFFRFLRGLFYIAAVAVIAFAAHNYAETDILIRIGDWQAAPSLAAALIGLVLLYFLLALALKLVYIIVSVPILINDYFKKRAVISRHQLLADGVRALVRGDSARALKVFQRLAKESEQDEIYTWLAAEAAEEIGDRKKRNQFLQRIAAQSSEANQTQNKKSEKSDRSIVAAAKARLAHGDSRLHDAFDILAAAGAPDGSPLLAKMYLEIAKECEKWDCALVAAYRLRAWSPSPERKQVVIDIAQQGLSKVTNKEQLQNFWKNQVSVEEQKLPSLLSEYINALHRCGDSATMTKTLERAVKTAGQTPEILSTIAALGPRKMCETSFAAVRTPEEPRFLPAMAQLAFRLELWGQARRYYQMAAALRPDPAYAEALKKIEDKIQPSELNGDSSV